MVCPRRTDRFPANLSTPSIPIKVSIMGLTAKRERCSEAGWAGFCWGIAVCWLLLGSSSLSLQAEETSPPPAETPAASEQQAEPPLHVRIDRLIAERQIGIEAEPADEATFHRRAYLDLIGRIPTRQETEAFLADEATDKRQRLIDRLIQSEEFPARLAFVLDLMLQERRGGKHVKSEEFRAYLEEALREEKPFHQLVAEILGADGSEERNRAASAFYLEREVESHVLTRDVGRVFFGQDLQCAQCHNHPLIDDYLQQDYYGLHAFFLRSSLFQPDKKKPALVAEQATGEAQFRSVFTEREGVIGGRVPGGEELAEVTLKPGEQYQVEPAKDVRPIPAVSRIERLSQNMAEAPSRDFAKNLANRMWAYVFGRGLVHPLDLLHSDNPPVYPEVLDLLTEELLSNGFQLRPLVHQLALTEAYGRSFHLPALEPSLQAAQAGVAKAVSQAESLAQQAAEASEAVEQQIEQLDEKLREGQPLEKARQEAFKQAEAALKAADQARTQAQESETKLAAQQKNVELVRVSRDSTQQAAEALNQDQELKTALATLEAKLTALTKTMEQAKAERDKLQTAREAAEQKLQAARKTADETIAALQPHSEQVRALRQQLSELRSQAQQLRASANVARRQATALEQLVHYGESRQQIESLAQQIAGGERQLKELTEKISQAKQETQTAQTALAEAEKTMQQQTAAFQKLEAAAKKQEQTAAQLQASITQTEEVQRELTEDENLPRAVALLQESQERINQERAELTKELNGAREAREAAVQRHQQAKADLEQRTQQSQQLQASLEQTRQQQQKWESERENELASSEASWEEIVQLASNRFLIARLVPVHPEQLAWNMLVATGTYQTRREAFAHKLAKEKPLSEEDLKKPEVVAAREREIEEETLRGFQSVLNQFIKMYAAEAGQPQGEFFATADQSLFAANGGQVLSFLQPSGENLIAELQKQDDPTEIARLLYLSLFSRLPSPQEVEDVTNSLAERPEEKLACLQELTWGLLCSVEFRFRY